jgi:hypothetical protein
MAKVDWIFDDKIDAIMDAIPDSYWMVKHKDDDIEEDAQDYIESPMILHTW